jgi:mono/diheme cytochrome c family protein
VRRGPALAFVLILGAGAGCEPDFERMVNQHRYDPYEPALFFEDGLIMRHPPAGTVPHQAVTSPPGLVDGTFLERIPLPVDASLVARGRNRFEIFCAACHGRLGDGESQVAENMSLRPPPSFHSERIREYSPGRMYHVIQHGYGVMRSYANELPPHDRWAVVAYVQALQLSQHAALADLPPRLREEADPWLK